MDLFRGPGPGERLGVAVPLVDPLADTGFEFQRITRPGHQDACRHDRPSLVRTTIRLFDVSRPVYSITTRAPWSRATSWPGGAPNSRRYSRVNCDALVYPTACPAPATSAGLASSLMRARCRRICFWY